MNSFAVLEAEAHGATFLPGEIERGFEKEEKALESWEQPKMSDQTLNIARKRWRAVIQRRDPGEWTHGQAYVRLWRENRRPDYTTMIGVESQETPEYQTTEAATATSSSSSAWGF